MDLNQLRTFLETAKCGSLTGASEKLCTSQPAISRQIVALEKGGSSSFDGKAYSIINIF